MITLAVAAVAWAGTAQAQERGTVEFGAFGSYGRFDKALTLNTGMGGGGHIGVFLDPRWALEFEMGEMKATRTLGLADVNVGILSSRIVVSPIKTGALSIQLGAGAGGSIETNFLHSYSINGLVGFKMAFSDNVALRADLIADWLANNDWKSGQRIQAGLSFFRGPSKETRTVEVPAAAVPCNCTQRADSVSADEQARRRRWEAMYNALRDSLSRRPAPAPMSSESARTTMEERIQFEFDKSDLTPAAQAILDSKVAVFNANPTMTLFITGHTGNMGTDNYNWALGDRRAASAKAYLVSKGIAASRIQVESKGESQPVVNAPLASGMAENVPNRRDMFRIVIAPDVIKQP
jgi:outer membrane protein OmpA-like peptidoglycan-associated protein